MKYVLIGKIVNTFGIKGELKVYSYTDFESERFKSGSTVYLSEEYIPVTVKSYRVHKNTLLVTLEGLEDINLVEKYRNMFVYKSSEDIKPLEDGYYYSDLKDLDVYVNNKLIGKVLNVEEGISANNLRILKEEDHKEYLVPFLDVFVENVDLLSGRIDIVDLEGLL